MLERLRPALNADGGDIELVALEGDVVQPPPRRRLCGLSDGAITLQAWRREALRRFRPRHCASRPCRDRRPSQRLLARLDRHRPESTHARRSSSTLALIGPGLGSVLVTGESGTGKEVVANALHCTARADKPFVALSCALFADTLIESELFGTERGAFTGAIVARPGRFERAQGGTLFLDDIDDVPLGMQVKLLRALQNRTIERLGGTRPIPIDVARRRRDQARPAADGRGRQISRGPLLPPECVVAGAAAAAGTPRGSAPARASTSSRFFRRRPAAAADFERVLLALQAL